MDYSNGFLTVCILTFSTAVCILGLILGVVFIFFQRQRDEHLLDDIHHTTSTKKLSGSKLFFDWLLQEKSNSSTARHSSSNKTNKNNKNNKNIPNGGAYWRKLVTRGQDLWREGWITEFNERVWESDL
ncbi:uncharacterized protein FMAN_16117 [Fusarium mangiferae]|uniref:Uncharacterized protein n=1 Tax=Fusarium mangiferae TaxID=192010 RepID=A0A1L7T305_FUSMA|nr:uncharacterized protein FMAN_16117 [Fusarium mangiferae]CVK93014.1 uncharacterized protein FMAN_16117 [Fusarium mangiferae]